MTLQKTKAETLTTRQATLESDHAKLSKLLAEEMKKRMAAEELLKEINQECALQSEGQNYATVQITPSTWEKIKRLSSILP